MTSIIRKRLITNNFLFEVILPNEGVFKGCFEIIKNKVAVKTESAFEKLLLCTQTN